MKKMTWWFTFSRQGRTITRQLEFTVMPDERMYLFFPDIETAIKELSADYLGLDLIVEQEFGARTSHESFFGDLFWVRFKRLNDLSVKEAVMYEMTL